MSFEAAPPLATSAGKKASSYVYLIALVAAVGGFLFGYDLSVISGALLFLKKDFAMSASAEGFATASAMIGCLIGPFHGCMIADKIGRKKTLLMASLLFLVSAIGTAIPPNLTIFNIFRIVGGIGVGIASVVSPMYIAEIAPARIRGGLVTMNQLAIVVGSVASTVVAYYIAQMDIAGNQHWRWMFASECLPIFALLIGLAFVPESPRWLVQRKREAEGMNTLVAIDGQESAVREMAEIRESLSQKEGTFAELFAPGMRMAMLVAIGLAMFQQVTGMSAISFYFPVIFQKAGYASEQAAIGQNIVVNVWQIFCTVVVLLALDRVGRRPVLLFGTLGMALGLFLLGVVFHMQLSGKYVLFVVFLANGAYLVSLAPLGWLIMSEIFPNRLRAKAMGTCGMLLWLAAFGTTYAFPPMREYFEKASGSAAGAFWVFAVVCVICFLFSLKFVPETKGKSLEEIGKSWSRKAA